MVRFAVGDIRHTEVPHDGDEGSLLSFIARRHTVGREDVATDALSFILSRSNSARRALSDLLGDDRGPLQVAAARPWGADALGAIPDLACFDEETTWSP